jgi:glyoxylase-like metal-dependent hydrolase (beta-lactamase superfamily II)
MKVAPHLALLLAALTLTPSSSLAMQADPAAPAIAPFVARQLAPGIHLLGTPTDYAGPAISNISIIEQSDGLVVIDSGATLAHGNAVVAYVRSISRKPVKALLFTHWHNDHPFGAAAIRAAWPRVRIISTPATRAGLLGPAATSIGLRPSDYFETEMWNQAYQSINQVRTLRAASTDVAQQRRYDRYVENLREFARGFRGTFIVPPTETFTNERLIDDAERPVRLMHLGRANTDGDAIAWLPRQRMVMTGDVVVWPSPFGFFSYPESWIGVLQRLKAMDYALLVPGHGEPQADTAYIDRLIATITDIRAQVGPLARQGLSLEETRARVNFASALEQWGTTPRLRAMFEGYWLTPMVENAWREGRGDPIIQGGGETTPTSVNRSRRN